MTLKQRATKTATAHVSFCHKVCRPSAKSTILGALYNWDAPDLMANLILQMKLILGRSQQMAGYIKLQDLKHRILCVANLIFSIPTDFSGLGEAKAKSKAEFGDSNYPTFRTRSMSRCLNFDENTPPERLKFLYTMDCTTLIVNMIRNSNIKHGHLSFSNMRPLSILLLTGWRLCVCLYARHVRFLGRC